MTNICLAIAIWTAGCAFLIWRISRLFRGVGITPKKPIRVRNAAGEYLYLEHLRDGRGHPVQALRRGIVAVPGFREPVDWWIVREGNGAETGLYFYGYGEKTTRFVPTGFRLAGPKELFAELQGMPCMEERERDFGWCFEPSVMSERKWTLGPNPPWWNEKESGTLDGVNVPPPDEFVLLSSCDPETKERWLAEFGQWLATGCPAGDWPAHVEGDMVESGLPFVHKGPDGGIEGLAVVYRPFGKSSYGGNEHVALLAATKDDLFGRGPRSGTFAPHRDCGTGELHWTNRRLAAGPESTHALVRVAGHTLGLVVVRPVLKPEPGKEHWDTRGLLAAWADEIRRANGEKTVGPERIWPPEWMLGGIPIPRPSDSLSPTPSTDLLIDGTPLEQSDATIVLSAFSLKVTKGGRSEGLVVPLPKMETLLGRDKDIVPRAFIRLDMDDRPDLAKQCSRRYAKITVRGESLDVEVANATGNDVRVDGRVASERGEVLQAKLGSRIELNPDWEFEVVDWKTQNEACSGKPAPATGMYLDGNPLDAANPGVPLARWRLKIVRGAESVGTELPLLAGKENVIGRGTALDRYRPGAFIALDMGTRAVGMERCARSYARIEAESGEAGGLKVTLLAGGHALKVDGTETREEGTVLCAKPGSRIELEPDWVFTVESVSQ